jgi:hypothetical protein
MRAKKFQRGDVFVYCGGNFGVAVNTERAFLIKNQGDGKFDYTETPQDIPSSARILEGGEPIPEGANGLIETIGSSLKMAP